ncbi:uncharacterized protein METZ01_LOCUS483230, partial [marine metagenome]
PGVSQNTVVRNGVESFINGLLDHFFIQFVQDIVRWLEVPAVGGEHEFFPEPVTGKADAIVTVDV